MEDVLIGQDRVAGDAIQKRLQHALASGNHHSVLLCLCLLGSIISNGLLRGNGGNDEGWIQPDEVQTERLEFGISVSCFRGLLQNYVRHSISNAMAGAHPGMDHVCDVGRIRVEGRLLCIGYLITYAHQGTVEQGRCEARTKISASSPECSHLSL